MASPDNPFTGVLLQIRQYLHQRREPVATDAARPILEGDNQEALFAVARLFSDAGMADQSAGPLERCTTLDPRNPIYRLVLARTYEQMGLAKKGALEYRAVLALDANNAPHGLAANLASHGDTDEAEDLLLQAVVKEPRLAQAFMKSITRIWSPMSQARPGSSWII